MQHDHASNADLLCLSHLRWDFVFQRPQHLMMRFATNRRVFFFEEPIVEGASTRLAIRPADDVIVATPHFPDGAGAEEIVNGQRAMLRTLLDAYDIRAPILWFYTPAALRFVTTDIPAAMVVYDCMDELSTFAGAPPDLARNERALLARADLVFTGGQSLYEAKRPLHPRVYSFPSSVDAAHFARAREALSAPDDQTSIPRPRLGYFGVIDERMDLALLRDVADLRPDWHLVLLGPVVKIDPSTLPRRANIHYLGLKKYEDLPRYIAGWDVALLPFARNDATRFISPTKTPEYLAAGRPVVSTSVRDVVRPYGERGLVGIADEPSDFVAAVEAALASDAAARQAAADAFLADMSWNRTWAAMSQLVDAAAAPRLLSRRHKARAAARAATVSATG